MRKSFQPLAILAAVILLNAESRAAIIHVSIPQAEQEFLALGEARNRDFDFNQDGRNDIRFTAGVGGFVVTALHYEAGVLVAEMTGGNFLGTTAVPLLYGTLFEEYSEVPGRVPYSMGIDPGGQGRSYLLSYGALDGSVGGVWYGKEAYMGFALETVVQGEFTKYYFGWLRIRELGGFGGYFMEYAYETKPNVPIFAGQVPEPSSILLIAFSSTCCLLSRRRRSRTLKNLSP